MAEEDGKLTLPFKEWADESMLTKEQNSYTWGKGDPKTNIGKILKIKPNFFTSPYDHNIYRYIVTFDDNTLYQLAHETF